MPRSFHHPSVDDLNLDRILHALSDPTRRNMVFRLMGCQGMNCSDAASDAQALPASTISFHTRILREAGLIHSEKRGVHVINTARKAEIDKRFPGLLHAILQHHAAEASEKPESGQARKRKAA